MIPAVLAPSVSKRIKEDLKRFDPRLRAVFNCITERWEIYRHSNNRDHWVVAVENDDGSYRPLDYRIFKKLWEMDILIRYGSMDAYERHLDEKKRKWDMEQERTLAHEMRCDYKEDRHLWQEAAENLRRGIINEPPPQHSKTTMSYSK